MICSGCDTFFSIDVPEDDGAVGRLINHSKYFPNAKMKKIFCPSRIPSLCLFAVEDIDIWERILYFYDEENFILHNMKKVKTNKQEIFPFTGRKDVELKKTKIKPCAKASKHFFISGVSLCLKTKYVLLQCVW